eukprot:GHVS01002424.1.p1 GENE.GHVS01002424.1~~GHVS01002424.1.p1  ORF type:complete len:119 (-),score=7.67 GHVS01002424.1:74-430(-)
MKTFRMIVLAVVAAIAIVGLTVDAFRCKKSKDCLEGYGNMNICSFNVRFGQTVVGDRKIGICSVDKNLMKSLRRRTLFPEFLKFVHNAVNETDESWGVNAEEHRLTFTTFVSRCMSGN